MSIPKLQNRDNTPYEWALEFDHWVEEKIAAGDYVALTNYELSPAGKLAVPTLNYYIPMLCTLGLATEKEAVRQVYVEVSFGGISMRTFQVG